MGKQYMRDAARRLAMPAVQPGFSPSAVGRWAFGGATIAAALLGLLLKDVRLLAAAGAFGTVWWAWDLLCDNVLGPIGRLFTGAITGASGVEEPPDLTVDDTVRLLESHLATDGVPRHVQIQSALRLAELYRFTRHDPAGADEVIRRMRAKWPDAKELQVPSP
jgi:hypothetical protein